MDSPTQSWQTHVDNLRRLSVFRALLETDVLRTALGFLHAAGPSPAGLQPELTSMIFYELSRDESLWSSPEFASARNPWEAWLIRAVLQDANAWTVRLERGEDPGPLLGSLAASDLYLLSQARKAVTQLLAEHGPPSPAPGRWQPGPPLPAAPCLAERTAVVRTLSETDDWSEAVRHLQAYFQSAGAGLFNASGAFRWLGADDNPLLPVRTQDSIRLEDFIGYQRQRSQVVENTERMLARLPAQNLLLYGDRGTGKSATVKALVHAYADQGLRLVEVPKRFLHDIHRIVGQLGRRGLVFILFVDDLSFEPTETEYKELKAALEGSLVRPQSNVRVYATSNRRHLVAERFSDRTGAPLGAADDEVRRQDTLQEKLSLADRFGLTIIFPTPSKGEYLSIVRGLADRYGIRIPGRDLEAQALRWADWQNGRSARTARQFVESLVQRDAPRDLSG